MLTNFAVCFSIRRQSCQYRRDYAWGMPSFPLTPSSITGALCHLACKELEHEGFDAACLLQSEGFCVQPAHKELVEVLAMASGIAERRMIAVSSRNTVFSAMKDLGSLAHPNPLFISSKICSSLSRKQACDIIASQTPSNFRPFLRVQRTSSE